MGKMEGSFSDKNMTSDGEGFAGSLQNNKEAIHDSLCLQCTSYTNTFPSNSLPAIFCMKKKSQKLSLLATLSINGLNIRPFFFF